MPAGSLHVPSLPTNARRSLSVAPIVAGEVAVQAGSHCIIFSADLAGSQFPIFGAGEDER